MKLSEVVSHSGLAVYAEVALVLFLIAFAIIAVRTFWPGRRPSYDHASRLPLEDGAEPQRHEEDRP